MLRKQKKSKQQKSRNISINLVCNLQGFYFFKGQKKQFKLVNKTNKGGLTILPFTAVDVVLTQKNYYMNQIRNRGVQSITVK